MAEIYLPNYLQIRNYIPKWLQIQLKPRRAKNLEIYAKDYAIGLGNRDEKQHG